MNKHLGLDQTSENSATQFAYNKLRDLILTGELAPGEKLKIDALRSLLDVGASPVREALSLLTSDQLVVRQDQRGFRTAATSPENFQEILSLRCELETMALKQSIANMTDAWAEAAVLAHHRMILARAESVEFFERQHKSFHMALVSNCQSPLLMRLCSQLYDLNIRYRYLAARASGYEGRKIGDEHRQILDAVTAADPDLASNLLRAHYTMTGAFLMKYIA